MATRLACALLCALTFTALADEPKFRLGPSAEINEPGKKRASAEVQQIATRALAAFSKGDLPGARKDFQKVLELDPGNVPTMINLGLLDYRGKNFGGAEKRLKQALQAAPESAFGWLILGVIYYDQDKLDAALGALAQAVYLGPKDARAHHYLGVTIGRKGWFAGAEDEMRKAIELAPDYPEAHFNLAVFYLQRTPPAIELARRHYQEALNLGAAPDPAVAKQLVTP